MPMWLIIVNIGVLIFLWALTLFVTFGTHVGLKMLATNIQGFEGFREEGWKVLMRLEEKVVTQSQWEKSDVFAISKQVILELIDEGLIKKENK